MKKPILAFFTSIMLAMAPFALKAQDDPRVEGKSPWDDYPFTDGRIFKKPNWKEVGFGK